MGTTPPSLPPEVIAAIESGRAIEAIKLLRQSTGLGLAEAKSAVDHYVRSRNMPASDPEAPLPPDVMQALRNGNKIEAVRLVRQHRGLGLREAHRAFPESLGAFPESLGAPPEEAEILSVPPQERRLTEIFADSRPVRDR